MSDLIDFLIALAQLVGWLIVVAIGIMVLVLIVKGIGKELTK